MASLNQFAADPNQKQKQPGAMRPQTGTGIQGRPPMQAGPSSGPIADPAEMRKRLAGMPGLADIDRRRLDDAAGRGMGAVKDVVRGRPYEADVRQALNGAIGAGQNKMGGARPAEAPPFYGGSSPVNAEAAQQLGQSFVSAQAPGLTTGGIRFEGSPISEKQRQASQANGMGGRTPPPGSQAGPAVPTLPNGQPIGPWYDPRQNPTTSQFPGGDPGTGKPWYDGPPMGPPVGGWGKPGSGGIPPGSGGLPPDSGGAPPKYDKAKAQSGYTSQDWGKLNKQLKALDPAMVAQWREQMQGIQAGGGRRYDFLNEMLANQAGQGQSPPFNPNGQTAPVPPQTPPIYNPPANPGDPPTQIPDIFLPF